MKVNRMDLSEMNSDKGSSQKIPTPQTNRGTPPKRSFLEVLKESIDSAKERADNYVDDGIKDLKNLVTDYNLNTGEVAQGDPSKQVNNSSYYSEDNLMADLDGSNVDGFDLDGSVIDESFNSPDNQTDEFFNNQTDGPEINNSFNSPDNQTDEFFNNPNSQTDGPEINNSFSSQGSQIDGSEMNESFEYGVSSEAPKGSSESVIPDSQIDGSEMNDSYKYGVSSEPPKGSTVSVKPDNLMRDTASEYPEDYSAVELTEDDLFGLEAEDNNLKL